MVIVVDAQIAGISGDMLLCALVNLGANKSKIINGIKIAEQFLDGSLITKLDFEGVKKRGISATSLILDCKDITHDQKASKIQNCISTSVEKIGLSSKGKNFANSSIESLMEAESKIHGEPIDSVHFHEASSIDTVIDIVGTAIALEDLNFFEQEIVASPVAVGGGTITFSHGTTSNPAAAILEIFKNSNISILGGQAKEELTTPTGASMLVNLAQSAAEFYPHMKINSIGYGAGKKDFEGFSNVLKIVEGKKIDIYERDVVKILETNVDDISGEVLGNVIEKIMANGAKDVTISPAIGKKGRPTNLISVICDPESMNSLLDLLMSETGTLGVRIRNSQRITIPRSIKKIPLLIENRNFMVRYKTSGSQNYQFKVESDDIKSISYSLNKSFKQTEELIRMKIKKILEKK